MKEAAYKSMLRSIIDYGGSVRVPHCNGLNGELENVQKGAARLMA